MKSGGRRRRKSEEKASWLGREALTNIASDKCAFAHLTVNLKTANFQHRIEGCGSARRGLCFGTIPCFACPSSLYLCGLLAVPQVKHGNEARVFFFAAVSPFVGIKERGRCKTFAHADESCASGFCRRLRIKTEREEMMKRFLCMFVALCAMLASAETYLNVTNVSCRQRYPWNGKVDIDVEVQCDDPTTNVSLYVTAKDLQHGKTLSVRTVDCADNVSTNVGELTVRAGRHRLTWDCGVDNPNVASTNVAIEVQGVLGGALYLVIDLSEGPKAISYPVSYLNQVPEGGWTDEYKTDKLVLRRIEPGTFMMGSPTNEVGRWWTGETQHSVTLTKPYYMGVFEMTQRQYALVIGTNPSYRKGDTRPVECVSYNDIRGTLIGTNWPSHAEVDADSFLGKIRVCTVLNFDLPTDAQWEYACRAGTMTALNNGRDLSNTDQDAAMDDVGRYSYNWNDGRGGYSSWHTKVGSYTPNAWGLYDMHGNVDEWCLDWFERYAMGAVTDPVGLASGSSRGSSSSDPCRVARGGCCRSDASFCRSAVRNYFEPWFSDNSTGFRLCCSAGAVGGEIRGDGVVKSCVRMPINTRGLRGVRIARESERLTYSTQWNGGETATIKVGDKILATESGEGNILWDTSTERPGRITLSHTSGDETLTADFVVFDNDVEVHRGILPFGQEVVSIESNGVLMVWTNLVSTATWKADKVHLIAEDVTIPDWMTLNIESGTVVKFYPGTTLAVSNNAHCNAKGVIFTHVNDDTIGGDTLFDGGATQPVVGEYTISGVISDDETTGYRYITHNTTLTGTLNDAKRLSRGSTYRVSGTFTVANGATLTIPAGTVLKMEQGAQIVVNAGGTLKANGTRAAPVVFTSINDDSYSGKMEGSNSNPQPGDWKRIDIAGTATFDFTRIAFASDTGDRGAINGTGGTITFDNGVVESMRYECVRINSGSFVSRNSVFRDAAMGFGYYGGSGTYVYNGVVADCTIACRASNKHFVNTVFYNCLTFLESTSSSADHCAFYNPPDWGAQTATQVGKNGNIWGDPLFVDAANGDFRIREGSPCVDAADSSAAPELDYFGQPRITFTGRTNDTELAEGPLADIGICEVMPRDVTSDIDLVPEAVRTETTATPGQLLFVKWEVRNQGGAPVDATWRDTVSLVSQDGREVVLGDKATKSAIAVGGSVFCSGYFTVPAMAEGTWYPKVNVNSYHDIFEGSLTANNALVGAGSVEVTVKEVESEGEEGVINAGAPTVKKITLPETGGNRMVRIKVPAGVTIRWGFGFVPTGNQKSGTLTSNGQDAIFRVPDGVTDVYVSMESDDGAEYDLSLEEGQVVITGISPNTLPSSGEVTITIDGAGFTEDSKVYLVKGATQIAPESVQYIGSRKLIAKVDCGNLTEGAAYGVSVIDTVNVVKENAVAVLSTLKPGKLYFELQSPVNARIGREYPCSISYGNVGELPIKVPVLQVSISGMDGTKRGSLGYVGGLSGLNRLSFVGAGQNPLAGMLLPGETRSIEFTYHAGNNDKIKLHAYSEDNNSRIDWNGSEIEFTAISQMASRLGLAGLNASDCDLVLDAVLSSNQVHNSFVSGKLVSFDQTKEAGVLRLVGESGMYHATLDSNGCFSFAGVEAGTYDVIHSHSHVEPSTVTVQKGKDAFELELKVPSDENCIVSVLNAAEGDALVTCMDLAYEKQFEARKVSSGEYVFTGLPEGIYSIRASDSEGKMSQAYFAASGSNLICQIQMELKPGLSISGVIKNRVSLKECAVVLRNGVNVDVKSVSTDGHFEYVGLPEDYYSLALYFVDENGQIRFENIETIDLKSTGSVVREYEVGESVSPLRNYQRTKNTSVYSTVSKTSSDYHWYDPDAAYKMFMDFYYECYAEWSKNGVHKPAPDLQCEHNVLKYYQDLVMWNTYKDVLELYLKGASKTSGWLFIAETSNLLHKFSDLTFDLFVDAYCGAAKGVYEAALKGMWSSITSLGKDYATEQILDDDGNVLMGSGDVQELKEKLDYYFSIAGKSDLAVDSARSLTYTLQKFQGRKKFWSKIGKYSKFGKGLAVLQNINSCLSLGKGFVENYDAAVRMWNARDDWNNSIEAMRDITKQLAVYRVRFNAAAAQFNKYKKCGCMSPMPLPQDSPYVESQISNPQSCDPNEMSGPLGLGDPETERYVKPGEWMTYTVYFENRADATAAAQEVRVTNPLSEYLDWSTFEMGEVAFNNQIDLGLSGRRGGTSEAVMKGTNTLVRTQLTLDEQTGTAEWYLRIVDPTTATGWPEDVFAGFLPPNDETFRGEGHLTYRVKVRDDAPHGVRIANSASIVFDYNEPIETDPSWWNTVARTLEAGFVEPEVMVDEGGTATVAVRGGSAERETSVQVSLAYQTASAADLDLKNAKVDGATPKGGVKFPLTLTWAAGEIGAKTITIPVKADRAVENEELFTLQLANAQGMGVGDASCCTVTIRDANAAADYAAKQGKTTVRTKKGVPDCALSIACVAMDGSGEPCGFTTGQGSYYTGCKASLKATARPGWAFAGWGEVEDGVTNVVSDKASRSVAVTDDADIIAFFDRIPYVRGLAHLADRGKVTGSGYCPAGKKVTLRAAANRGYVFEGWYGAKDGNAGEVDLSGQPVAKTPALIVDRTARPAKNDARQTVITEVDGSVTYFAKFITNQEDIEAVSLDLDGVPLSAEDAFATNLICGVAVDWPVVSGGLSATTVKASGLPAGLKLVQDRATRAYSVVGVPTTASKVDKSDNVKPSVAKFTVTTAGRNARTFVVEIAVSPLPTWAVGSFDGAVQMGDIVGAASMTVAANGRVSGKYGLCGTNWTFSASGYTEFIDDDIETNRLFALDVMAKSGRMLRDLRIEVTPGWMADIVAYRFPDAWIMEEDARAYAESLGMSWPYDPPLECVTQEVSRINCSQANGADVADAALMLHRGIWKDYSAKSREPMVDGLFDWWPVLEPWRNWVFDAENFPDVKMSVATSGRVSFAGKLPDGVRASSSTTAYLVPESGHPRALFIVPTTKNAAGLLDEVVCPHDDL